MRQAKDERKQFQSRISFLPDPGQKIPKKMAKKFKKLKNIILALFLSEPGIRQNKEERRIFQSRILFLADPVFRHYFYPKWVEIGREREEKKNCLEFLSYSTRVRKFQKNSKIIQKIQKHHSGVISIQTGMRQTEEEKKKNCCPEFPSYTTWDRRKFQKKIVKKFEKLKNIFPALFLSKTVRQAEKEKKKFSPEFCSYLTRVRNFQKKQQKNSKKTKKIIPALFLSKPG